MQSGAQEMDDAVSANWAGNVPSPIRRTLEYSLIGMLLSGYVAVLGTGLLDWPIVVFGGAGLLLRALMAANVVQFQMPPRVSGALALVYLAFFPVDWRYVSGSFLQATIHMAFFLAVLKLITAKTAKDFGYLKAVAGMELIAGAVLSTSATFLIYLVVFLFFAIIAYASGEIYRGAASGASISRFALPRLLRRLAWLSGFLFAGILVMTVGLFTILPRTARAAFGARLGASRTRLAGFSNSVTLGEIGELKRNDTPVMHVRSYQDEGFLPVKWRGSVLTEFDGTRWFNEDDAETLVRVDSGVIALRSAVIGTRQGHNLIYQARLSPIISDTLFFAGNPETIRIDVPFLRYARGGVIHVPGRFTGRGLNYSVYGFLPDEWAEVRFTTAPLAGFYREQLLKLPKALDPRIPKLAEQMSAGAENDVQKARAIESHLRNDYGYTLELLSQHVDDPLAYFLFDRKKGHCEYFASAMAVLLRTEGIPSRVVTGFQSGSYNPLTKWQVVRASDAHSWVEAWLDGRGWTTFDPTPSDPTAGDTGLSKFSMLFDVADQWWQDWIVSYDVERQVALFTRMRETSANLHLPNLDNFTGSWGKFRDFSGLRMLLFGVLSVLLAIAAWMLAGPWVKRWWRNRAHAKRLARGRIEPSDATILYERFLRLVEKRGVRKPPWLTPVEFVGVLTAPDLAALAADATASYNDLRFGGHTDAASRLKLALDKIEQL